MTQALSQFIQDKELSDFLLSPPTTEGFIAAMAVAPYLIDPAEWISFMWGNQDGAPFSNHDDLEHYAQLIIDSWNEQRQQLLTNQWEWSDRYAFCDKEIVNQNVREFCEGFLQGWGLIRDDWETLMPEDSQDNALMGGVLLSISLLFDPEAGLTMMQEQGTADLAQFEEIFKSMPVMLCGLTLRGQQLAAQDSES